MYEPFNKETASTKDRAAFVLSEIIDDSAPLRWTKYRGFALCIAANKQLMADLQKLASED